VPKAPFFRPGKPGRSAAGELVISVSDIDWIAAAGNYALLHVGSREYEIRQTLTSLEAKLNPRELRQDPSLEHRQCQTHQRDPALVPPPSPDPANGQELRMSRYQRAAAKQLGMKE
jgi:two-component system, LytTR family, response regulator